MNTGQRKFLECLLFDNQSDVRLNQNIFYLFIYNVFIYAINHQNTVQLMEIFKDRAKHQNKLLRVCVCVCIYYINIHIYNHNHYHPSNMCSA